MLDIVGYWSAVTIICAFLIYPWIFIAGYVIQEYIKHVTNGEKGEGIVDYLKDKLTLGDKTLQVPETCLSIVSLGLFLGLSVIVLQGHTTYITIIHGTASKITPFFTTMTPVVIGLLLMDKTIKKCYHYSKLLKKLEKV